ncbi:hypothetical protein HOY34_14615 [Xinfangfangia sp. D13-10-4-6]|uniref:DUF6625 family protein n=1 Tax=Pseudogemmobacter hezensis TaxID=2737662 RepID=UPI00155582CE|nr:DUF6625 family protein [Pseudogemmobacter hezensis]NPD16430.1 hypothetical protein [Pseudogemmobacter hezensis]
MLSNTAKSAERPKRVLLISPWFGPWPEWINLFVESCRWNAGFDWLIPTDQDFPENQATNVHFVRQSFDAFREDLAARLKIDAAAVTPYKLCDLKPAYGAIFAEHLLGYSHWGFCDLDIIFGDLTQVYTDITLARYDVISTLRNRLSGHLSIFRNTQELRELFREIPDWQQLFSRPGHVGIDERQFSHLIRPRSLLRRLDPRRLWSWKYLFAERYTTPGGTERWPRNAESPALWQWKDGVLSHGDPNAPPLYLHLMFWNSDRWLPEHLRPAPWTQLPQIMQCDWREAAEKGFTISAAGIRLL